MCEFKPLKILVVSEDPDLPETHIYRGLQLRGHQISLLGSPQPNRKVILEESGVHVESLTISSRIDRKAIQTIKKALVSHSVQCIYAPTNRGLSCTVLATLGRKIPLIGYRGTIGHISWWDPSSWLTYLSPKISAVACVSHAVEEYLKRYVAEEKLTTIYKGHDIHWYHAAPREALDAFSIPRDACVISCTANMRPVKGVDLLINAFCKISDRFNAHLLLVGEVRDPVIAQLAKSNSKIHLAGYRSDATALVGATDIFVMPSREREGFPKAVLEASSLGIPSIVSNVGGMPEIVQHEKTGLVIPSQDVTALAEALTTLIEAPPLRKIYGQAARKRMQEVFQIEKSVEEMELLFMRYVSS